MTNLGSVLKSRDITLTTKFCIVKTLVLPVVMYSSENWTVTKAEGQKLDALELWCWKRLLKVPWTARSSKLSILRDWHWIVNGRTDAEAEAQGFWSSEVDRWLIEKVPDAGKDRGQKEKRAWDAQAASLMQWTWTWANFESLWGTGRPDVLQLAGSWTAGHDSIITTVIMTISYS